MFQEISPWGQTDIAHERSSEENLDITIDDQVGVVGASAPTHPLDPSNIDTTENIITAQPSNTYGNRSNENIESIGSFLIESTAAVNSTNSGGNSNKRSRENENNASYERFTFDQIEHANRAGVYLSNRMSDYLRKEMSIREKNERKKRRMERMDTEGSVSGGDDSERNESESITNSTSYSEDYDNAESTRRTVVSRNEEREVRGRSRRRRRRRRRHDNNNNNSESRGNSQHNNGSGGDRRNNSNNNNNNNRDDGSMDIPNLIRDIMENKHRRINDSISAMSNCFGCCWTNVKGKVTIKDIGTLFDFFDSHYGRMNNDALASAMASLYNRNIYEKYKKAGIDLPEWPAEMIKEHFLYHILDHDVVFTEILRTYFHTFMIMRDSYFTEHTVVKYLEDKNRIDPETGEPVKYRHEEKVFEPNPQMIKCGTDVGKFLKEIFKLSTSEIAPERRRRTIKNMNPSLVCAERIEFEPHHNGSNPH
jgi:hypothetical protein